jgi:hypothetical protein
VSIGVARRRRQLEEIQNNDSAMTGVEVMQALGHVDQEVGERRVDHQPLVNEPCLQ